MSDQGSGSRRDSRDDRDRDGGRGRGGSGSGGPGGGAGAGGRRFYRRKKVDHISYRDADMLRQFLGDGGKILPRRHTGLSAQNQRLLKRAIKRARNIALLPFGGTEN